MITSVFKKSTPINYSFVVLLMLIFFFLYQIIGLKGTNSLLQIGEKGLLLLLLLASIFFVNFISKKNNLTKDSTYPIFFFFLFILIFPTVFDNLKIVIANFFVLLALRRLFSIQTLKSPKEKIFDASLWIFLASLFYFWTILYIILVFISIIFHVSRDYRNWLIPIVAFLTVVVLFVLYSFLTDINLVYHFMNNTAISFQIDYFTNNYQNLALSIFSAIAIYFVFSSIFSLSGKPLNLQSLYKKVVLAFFIGVIIYLISPNKSNDLLMFTLFPLAIMTTNNIEYLQIKIRNEIVLAILIISSLICFFLQL